MMEFRDLKRQYAALKPQMDAALLGAVADTTFIGGAPVARLEERLARYTGRRHCVTCGNGTDALELMFKGWGITEGDAVFVPDFTFFSSGEAVCATGGTPVFVDVRNDTFNMDAKKLDAAIIQVENAGKLRPWAVLAVDLFGQTADYDALEKVAKAHNVLLFSDAAQSFGSTLNGKRACSFGIAAVTSFFPAKPLGCYGDGGAVFTDDDEKAALIRSLAVHGKGKDKYDNLHIGRNSRLDTLQSVVLQVKMDAFEQYELNKANPIAIRYTERLTPYAITPAVPAGMHPSWALYTLKLENRTERDILAKKCRDNGIPTMVYYPVPMSGQKAFEDIHPYQVDLCPVSKQLTETVLSLPFHPYLKDEEIEAVCHILPL